MKMKQVTDKFVLQECWNEFSKAMSRGNATEFGKVQNALKEALPEIQRKYPNIIRLEIGDESDAKIVKAFER